jgi:hypothetical protein
MSAFSLIASGMTYQSAMDANVRRSMGVHYTDERNILRLIRPLFLDALWEEFHAVRTDHDRLLEFHKRLGSLTFFDPACGCGNFLIVTYQELKRLELEVTRTTRTCQMVTLGQFHGIEIDERAVRIVDDALRLGDGGGPHIVCGNALTLDWNAVLPAGQCSYVLGNPPFVGAKYMDDAQRADARVVFDGIANAGLLDLVAAWYVKAVKYMQDGRGIPRTAFVSTSAITQGEQVGVLWSWLLAQGVKIHFAHRPFQWSNEARGKAAVHCVIIGFGLADAADKTIYEYADLKGEPHAVRAAHINPYLVDAPDVVLERRSKPICTVPKIGIGNMPIDGGHYLFTDEQKAEFLRREPQAEKWFRRWLGADEFINGYQRWCLWLGDCPPDVLRRMPEAMKRVEAVRQFRLASKSAPTRKLAHTPTRFHVENMPTSTYLLIPKISSEHRDYIPIGFMHPDTFSSDLVFIVPDATLYHFGILTSAMHMAWVRAVCGRLQSDYRYSAGVVYNNFPWPECSPSPQTSPYKGEGAKREAIEAAAQAVLDARAQFPDATLADLYDPLTMPPALLHAHQKLDEAVDLAYGKTGFRSDAERVAFLFTRYQDLAMLQLSIFPRTCFRSGYDVARHSGFAGHRY